jgi:hypothetical protein
VLKVTGWEFVPDANPITRIAANMIEKRAVDGVRLPLKVAKGCGKAAEGSRTPRPVGYAHGLRDARSVVECGCPLPLSHAPAELRPLGVETERAFDGNAAGIANIFFILQSQFGMKTVPFDAVPPRPATDARSV